jgi:glycerol-3-phosphate acyltransferase PlsY
MLGIWPYFTLPALAALVVFVAVYKLAGYISVASMVAAIAFSILYVLMGLAMGWPLNGRQMPLLIATILLAVMIIYKHRGNIARLMAGTEHKANSSRG